MVTVSLGLGLNFYGLGLLDSKDWGSRCFGICALGFTAT